MDAQGTMRLMFDTMDAYDRGDFDRLAEIYAEDAQWINADPKGPHCRNRDDIFTMFRHRREAGIRIAFDEMRSTPAGVVLTARVDGRDPVVSVFSFQGRRIVTVRTTRRRRRPSRCGAGGGGGVAGDQAPTVERERVRPRAQPASTCRTSAGTGCRRPACVPPPRGALTTRIHRRQRRRGRRGNRLCQLTSASQREGIHPGYTSFRWLGASGFLRAGCVGRPARRSRRPPLRR
jgi:SnoaL-like domain